MIALQATQEFDPKNILVAIREAHRQNRNADFLQLEVGLRRLHGGLNNTVYEYNQHGQQICIKICRVDERHRAEREWHALQFLAAHQPYLAPEPLWFFPDPEFPAVVMTFIPGQPLHQARIAPEAIDSLVNVLHQLYTMRPDVNSYPYVRVGAVTECLRRIEDWAVQFVTTPKADLVERVQHLIRRWIESNDRWILHAPAQAVFARGDPNLANCLWDGTNLRLIDLEYAGWSDIAFELADLVEHINARSISDEDWDRFLDKFISTGSNVYQRFRAAQRTCALLWIILLWQYRNSRMPALLSQIERVEHLQRQG